MTDDGPILNPWLKGQIATTQSFRMHASQWVWSRLGGDQSGRFRNPVYLSRDSQKLTPILDRTPSQSFI